MKRLEHAWGVFCFTATAIAAACWWFLIAREVLR